MIHVRAVIFDLGQVLVHYDHQQSLQAVTALGQATMADVEALFLEVAEAIGVGQLDAVGLHRHYVEGTQLKDEPEAFFTAFGVGLTRNEAALAYAVELQARPEVTVAIISNTNEAHAYWLDEYLPELQQFDLVILSNEVGLAKPDPEIFQLALELLTVDASQAVFIDDLAANVRAAQALGLHGIVHTDWALTRPALEAWLAAEP
jgi:epoxide hydrolase-like predicted phosphatase